MKKSKISSLFYISVFNNVNVIEILKLIDHVTGLDDIELIDQSCTRIFFGNQINLEILTILEEELGSSFKYDFDNNDPKMCMDVTDPYVFSMVNGIWSSNYNNDGSLS